MPLGERIFVLSLSCAYVIRIIRLIRRCVAVDQSSVHGIILNMSRIGSETEHTRETNVVPKRSKSCLQVVYLCSDSGLRVVHTNLHVHEIL
jgi:hypothetical protein